MKLNFLKKMFFFKNKIPGSTIVQNHEFHPPKSLEVYKKNRHFMKHWKSGQIQLHLRYPILENSRRSLKICFRMKARHLVLLVLQPAYILNNSFFQRKHLYFFRVQPFYIRDQLSEFLIFHCNRRHQIQRIALRGVPWKRKEEKKMVVRRWGLPPMYHQ